MNLHEHTQLMKAAILFSFVYVTMCGTAYSQKKEPELIDSLVSALPDMKDDTFKVNTLKKIAAGYRKLLRKEEETYLVMQYELSKKLNYQQGTGDVLLNLAACYLKNNQYKKAQESLEEAVRIYGQLGDREGLAMALNNIGSVSFCWL